MLKIFSLLVLLSLAQSMALAAGSTTEIICKTKSYEARNPQKERTIKLSYTDKAMNLLSVTLENQEMTSETYAPASGNICSPSTVQSNLSQDVSCERKSINSEAMYILVGTMSEMQFDTSGKLTAANFNSMIFGTMTGGAFSSELLDADCSIVNN